MLLDIKKIPILPMWLVRVLLATSFVLAESISARSAIFMLSTSSIAANMMISSLNFMIYIMMGMFYWGILELVVSFFSRSVRQPHGVRRELTRKFFIYYAITNVCVFLFKLSYYWHPNIIQLGDIVITPTLYFIGFLAMIYYSKDVVPKHQQGRLILNIATIYFGANLIFTLASIFNQAA